MGLSTQHAQALVAVPTGGREDTTRLSHQKAIALTSDDVFFDLSYADSLLLVDGKDAHRAAGLRQEAHQLLGGTGAEASGVPAKV